MSATPAEVIAECVRDIWATRDTNKDPAVIYELNIAAESLIRQVSESFGITAADIRPLLVVA